MSWTGNFPTHPPSSNCVDLLIDLGCLREEREREREKSPNGSTTPLLAVFILLTLAAPRGFYPHRDPAGLAVNFFRCRNYRLRHQLLPPARTLDLNPHRPTVCLVPPIDRKARSAPMPRTGGSNGVGALRSAVLSMARLLAIGYTTVAAAPLTSQGHGGEGPDTGGTPLWILAVASLVLTLTGGVFAGLTIAYVTCTQCAARAIVRWVLTDSCVG